MTPTADDVRAELRAFVDEAWDPDLSVAQWWKRLAEGRWAVPTWPEEWWGRALPQNMAAVVRDELTDAGALGPPAGLGFLLAGPTILAHGTDEQRRRYLRPIIDGTEAWCQLFSEPGAGSDLASLQCRAERDGDEWVVTGQKVWTSFGHQADLGMLIARTDPDLPKHQGITYFALPMDQPGVDVRPLREMTGHAMFNEVFLDEARVLDADRIGGLGEGWRVTNTTLAAERAGLGSGGSGGGGGAMAGHKGGMLEIRAGDLVQNRPRGANAAAGRGAGPLVEMARQLGNNDDPVLRQELARLHILNEVGRMSSERAKAGRRAGREVSGAGNMAKLMMSQVTRLTSEVGLAIIGNEGMLLGRDTPGGGAIQGGALYSPAVSIYGGSDEIQRNIIGERVLGLPKEPGPDRDTPFRDLLLPS